MDEIVVNWSIVTGATIGLGFLFNQALKLLSKRWPSLKPSEEVKKGVTFGTAFGLSIYFVAQSAVVPEVTSDPSTWSAFGLVLASMAGSAFKVSQKIYDVIGKKLFEA